jgi:hypothetical protein
MRAEPQNETSELGSCFMSWQPFCILNSAYIQGIVEAYGFIVAEVEDGLYCRLFKALSTPLMNLQDTDSS